MSINTLSEIQRLCIKQSAFTAIIKDSECDLIVPSDSVISTLKRVEHPTRDFRIYSDGIYYLVWDSGKKTCYKLRDRQL